MGIAATFGGARSAAADALYRTADGLVVYLGILPAELIKGHRKSHPETTMHGGASRDAHEHHLISAVFDQATGNRVSDAAVTATVSGLGLAGQRITLEPMRIDETVTYGGFVDLPEKDLYTVKLEIRRRNQMAPVSVKFVYDHRLP
jgi:hypothetical protein